MTENISPATPVSSPHLTPLMRQYWDIKSLHQDKILLFRMGDFFEMFFDDAIKAAPILGIALTSRNKKSQDETPMCGMPHHSVAGPINKLLKQGLKVAICDQIEDPKTAKGIVKRAVTRILTPGMVYDPDTLEASLSNYIASIEAGDLACVDTSTGEAFYFSDLKEGDIQRLLQVLPIVEIVLSSQQEMPWSGNYLVSRHSGSVENMKSGAAARLLSYVRSLGTEETLQLIKPFEHRELQGRMEISMTTLRHLEIFSTYKGQMEGSLFFTMDRCKTAVGSRLLRNYLQFPLTTLAQIERRLDEVQKWKDNIGWTLKIRDVLAQMGDIERRLTRIAQPNCTARDLLAMARSVQAAQAALAMAKISTDEKLTNLVEKIDQCVVDEPPLSVRQGHIIRKGIDPVLDELILLSTDSQSLLMQMETREKSNTGISSLKIRYNNVFGYYIEVTHTHIDKVPAHYMRKQTLASAERYCTDELIELEKKVLSAQTRRAELEYEIFESLRKNVLHLSSELLKLSTQAGELDLATALAVLAIEKKYVRPQFTQGNLSLHSSRHPVVESSVKKAFIANTLEMPKSGCMLLTGPNMAGKSTLMRQVALTHLMAQMGSFVPAEKAQLPILDQIFTRIGASDQLSEGLSTFMVEMLETAEMLKKATPQSLLILDEVGRGTSTYDGMSLAQSILEYILENVNCLTLFATHYHELTEMERRYPHLKNAHMTVVEKAGDIRFLYTLVAGPALKSYGIQVAKLAGLPSQITQRASELLQQKSQPKGEQLRLL